MEGMATAVFLGALISIAVIALMILLGVWTYRDAQSRNMNGILWTLVAVLVPGCIGLIIYLVVRMDNNKVKCSNCGAYVNGKSRFCSNCGMELVPVTGNSEDEAFEKSQRKILIGFFSTLGGTVVLSIFLVASLIVGGIKLAGNILEGAASWISETDMLDALEGSLGDWDVFFDEDEVTIQEDPDTHKDKLILKDKEGNELIVIDGDENSVDIDIANVKKLLDKYGIEYDDTVSEEEIREEIREAIDDMINEYDEKEQQ